MDDEDNDIYGADPTPTETPDQPAAHPEPQPINPIPEEPVPEPQIDLPIFCNDELWKLNELSEFDWHIIKI